MNGRMKHTGKGRQRGEMWENFKPAGEGRVVCRNCGKNMASGNATRCRDHLASCMTNLMAKVKDGRKSGGKGSDSDSDSSSSSSSSSLSSSASDFSGPMIKKTKTTEDRTSRSRDPVWQHFMETGGSRNHYMCRYCARTMYPNPTRLKEHLRVCTGDIQPEIKAFYISKLGPPPLGSNQNRPRSKFVATPPPVFLAIGESAGNGRLEGGVGISGAEGTTHPGGTACSEGPTGGTTEGTEGWSSYRKSESSRLKSSEYLRMKLDDRGIALGYILDTYKRCLKALKGHQWADMSDMTIASELLDDLWNSIVDTTVGCDDLFDRSMKSAVPHGLKRRMKDVPPPATTLSAQRKDDEPLPGKESTKQCPPGGPIGRLGRKDDELLPLPECEEFTQWTTTPQSAHQQAQQQNRPKSKKHRRRKSGVSGSESDTMSGFEPGSASETEEVVLKKEANEECILPDLGNEISTVALVPQTGITGLVSEENEKSIYDFYTAYQDKGVEWIYERTCHYGIDRAQLEQIIQHYDSGQVVTNTL